MTTHDAAWHEDRAEGLLTKLSPSSPLPPLGVDEALIQAGTAAAHAQLATSLRLAEARRPIKLDLDNRASAFVAAMLKAKGQPPASAA